MSTSRPTLAASAAPLGRRARRFVIDDVPLVFNDRADDARLFALTFVGGFLFMSVYLA